MFFLHDMERVITLHPSFFGPRIKEYLINKLLEDVEGTCNGQYFVICVMDTYEITQGHIVPGSGVAEFTIHYKAVVWRPFKGEVVDAVVSSVNKMGFFGDVGPLPLFVSTNFIPSEIKFDANATPPQFTDNADQVIEKGTHVRVKLIGLRSDVSSVHAIGSIKEDSLRLWADDLTRREFAVITDVIASAWGKSRFCELWQPIAYLRWDALDISSPRQQLSPFAIKPMGDWGRHRLSTGRVVDGMVAQQAHDLHVA